MDAHSLLIARFLFWVLSVCTLFLPLRWSFFCAIIASHLDITNPMFASSAAIGLENSFRVVALPLILLCRLRFAPLKDLKWTLGHKLWIALIVYAAIAISWSDYRLSGIKMVAYLGDYFLFFQIFYHAWLKGILGVRLIRTVAWAAIALATVQTYLLGNVAGTTEERFTSYSSPQYFAAFLLAVLALLVFSHLKGVFHYFTCAALVISIALSGSRYIFVSTLMLMALACFRSFRDQFRKVKIGKILVRASVAVLAFSCFAAALLAYFPSARVGELFGAGTASSSSVEDAGTLAWRFTIYAEMLNRLENRSLVGLFLGSGTSSGADLMLNLDPQLYAQSGQEAVDGNRVLHSEFLRALYEWGVPGLTLLCLFVLVACVGYLRKLRKEGGGGPSLAFLGLFPSMVFGLAIENLLAGAASDAGIGIVLTMAYAWCGARGRPGIANFSRKPERKTLPLDQR